MESLPRPSAEAFAAAFAESGQPAAGRRSPPHAAVAPARSWPAFPEARCSGPRWQSTHVIPHMACRDVRHRVPSVQWFSSWHFKQASARTVGSPVLKLKISPGSLPRVSTWRLAGPWHDSQLSPRCTLLCERLGIGLVAGVRRFRRR